MVGGERLGLESEWPFEAHWLVDEQTGAEGRNRQEGIWAYKPPSDVWEKLDLFDKGMVQPLPSDVAGLGAVMGALDVHGACVLRGDTGTTATCAELARALSAEYPATVVKGVAQRFPESHPLIAHPVHMKLCAGALGRQLLRIASLDELRACMSPSSIFTDGANFEQLPFELDYARALWTRGGTKLSSPCVGAAIIPAASKLENQLTCFWAVDTPAILRFAQGSHRWPLGRNVDEMDKSRVVEVVLNPGDSLFCASRLQRETGGHNSLILEVGYHLAFWQTEEENQMAIGSPRAALRMPHHISRLVGWCNPGAILNKQYSGGQRKDPLGATHLLRGRPVDWAGHVWTSQTVSATPKSLKVGNDDWCCPQAFRDGKPWSEYPNRFGKLDLPPPDTSALTSIYWPGNSASTDEVMHAVEQCIGILERDGAVILANAVEHVTVDKFLESIRPYSEEERVGVHEYGAVGCLIARSTAVLPIVAHPCVMGVCEGVLGRQVLTMDDSELQRRLRLVGYNAEAKTRIPWQLHVQACTSKRPGEKAQELHRDGEYVMLALPAEQIEHEVCPTATDITTRL